MHEGHAVPGCERAGSGGLDKELAGDDPGGAMVEAGVSGGFEPGQAHGISDEVTYKKNVSISFYSDLFTTSSSCNRAVSRRFRSGLAPAVNEFVDLAHRLMDPAAKSGAGEGGK